MYKFRVKTNNFQKYLHSKIHDNTSYRHIASTIFNKLEDYVIENLAFNNICII